jgi:dTDP-4-amino-4,6-dideoxygalactose transaminase
MASRLYLSPPYLSGEEQAFVQEALASGWIAPLGPQVEAFEREFAETVGVPYALALSSGTAALHLALIEAGVQAGDEVAVSTLTFAASAFPIVYLGARPVFIDSERQSWNMDPDLLAEWLNQRARVGRLPKAVVLVHLYGQSANILPILELCQRYGIALVEDAAEALGATYCGKAPGTFGLAGIYSFNGNKIITTSGGGMLVSHDERLIAHARKLATQAREPFPYYEHAEIGYNYRLSNLLAAVGRAQLHTLEQRVQKRRWIFEQYRLRLQHLPGVEFMPEAPWGQCTRWLSVILLDPNEFGATPETVRLALEAENIESRPIWKPLHLQPVFAGCETVGGAVAEDLFRRGLCLPSGTGMTEADIERVVEVIQRVHANCRKP